VNPGIGRGGHERAKRLRGMGLVRLAAEVLNGEAVVVDASRGGDRLSIAVIHHKFCASGDDKAGTGPDLIQITCNKSLSLAHDQKPPSV
jgi:hypothetical protein